MTEKLTWVQATRYRKAMGNRTLYALVGVAGVVAVGLLGHELRKRQDATDLSVQATRLLHEGADRAPDLTHIQAQAARGLLDEALQLHDDDSLRALRHVASALAYLQKQEFDRAADRAELAEGLNGVTADTAFVRAAVARGQSQPDAALNAASEALRLSPRHTRAALLKADLLLENGAPDEALATLDALSARSAPAATVENRRGVALEALQRHEQARAAFTHAIELDGSLHQPHLNLARQLRAAGETQAALAAFLAAAKRAPSDVEPHIGMGLCRISLGDYDGAEADLEQAARLTHGQDATLLMAMGDLALARRDLVMAAEHYEAAQLAAPDVPLAYLKRGNTFMLLGRRMDAADAYRESIRLDPKLAAAHNGLGAALLSLGVTEEAALALQRAADLDPQDPNPLLNLARLHRSLGDETQAQVAIAAARERDPKVALARL